MSVLLSIAITDAASPAQLLQVQALESRQPLHAVCGKRLEYELRNHFEEKNAAGNRQHWPSLGFWARIRSATSLTEATDSGATVTIADAAMRQKYYGGTIVPKEAQFLALPARQEASGVSPRSMCDLRFIPLSGDRGMLVQDDQSRLSDHREIGGAVMYWLVRSVDQDPDPTALPAPAVLNAAMREETLDWLERLTTAA